MTVMCYEPVNLLNQLQREVKRLFETSRLGDEESGRLLTSDWAPAVDSKEEDNCFTIHADVPGVNPKGIDISMKAWFKSR